MSHLNFSIKTFGCKVNTYDTGLLQKRLAQAGYVQSDHPSIHILNTCAVTEQATREAIRNIRRLKAKNPLCTVVVTGCAAQVDTDQFQNLKGADLIVANSHKGDLEDLIKRHLRGELTEKVFKSNIFKKEDLESGGGKETTHTRTFLKIQDGCNSFCTYCVIPFARGKSRSLSFANLTEKVNELYDDGVREVVLTGVHIGDYEDDTRGSQGRLEDLIEYLLKNTLMPRFRLSSIEPPELSERLLDIYENPRMCPHFHMSIQSAQTRVLDAMKRQYDAKSVELSLNAIAERVPGSFVGMDVIVGFPGESDVEFEETFQRLESLPWTRIHVFPYSERPGTFANRIEPKVPQHKIVQRAARLRELSADRYAEEALKQVGTIKEALVLKSPAKGGQGITQDYWPVAFDSEGLAPGSLVKVKIKGFDYSTPSRMEGCLVGEKV